MASRPSPPARTTGGRRRFSSTSRLAKMPRSSGQKASPRRAMRFEGRSVSSCPSKRMEPWRRGTMPMTALRVVVLPAPLRPSSVTTSPGRTSKSTPWRMCDSPYQAWRSRTSRRAPPAMASGVPLSHVGLDHLGVARDRRIVALGEEHHLGLEGEGRSDLERPLASVGQLHGRRGGEAAQAHRLQELERPPVEAVQRALRAPEIEGATSAPLERDAYVLQHGQMREDGGDLEGAHETLARDVGGTRARDVVPLEPDAAPGRSEEVGEQVETGGLARAVRPDEGVDAAPPHLEPHVLHGHESPEFLGQALGFQDEIAGHRRPMIAMAKAWRKRV